MANESVLEFDNFRLTERGLEFDAFNAVGRLTLVFDTEWISDNLGDEPDPKRVETYFFDNRKHIENAAIALIGARPELGNPLGALPYSGFAKAPFHKLRVR
jgi:hypothetical protein